MLCLAWLVRGWYKEPIEAKESTIEDTSLPRKSTMALPIDRIMDRMAMERVDALLSEISSDTVREPLCEIRLLGDNRRRRSSSRVHYRRNVRRVLSDCRRAKRYAILLGF